MKTETMLFFLKYMETNIQEEFTFDIVTTKIFPLHLDTVKFGHDSISFCGNEILQNFWMHLEELIKFC
jgi:hypothetical protein